MKRQALALATAFLLSVKVARAHCPLCTVGAAAAAGGAAVLGVNNTAIGIFIGAFAVSMGWWFGKAIKKRFIPHQKLALIVLSFITTVLPIKPILSNIQPLYISWLGSYGTTLAIDTFLIGSLLGGIIVSITPSISKSITVLRRGKIVPFQGVMLTLGLLLAIGTIVQFVL